MADRVHSPPCAQRPAPVRDWLEQDGALLRLRLNRPKANLIDAEMIAALDGALVAFAASRQLRGVLLDSEGPHFSFGASVEEHLPVNCAQMLSSLHALLVRMLQFPVPILVAVRGQCLGGGLEVALGGGLIFAAPDGQFGQPEIGLGVFAPAATGSIRASPTSLSVAASNGRACNWPSAAESSTPRSRPDVGTNTASDSDRKSGEPGLDAGRSRRAT